MTERVSPKTYNFSAAHQAIRVDEYKKGNINITYGVHDSPFGQCLIGVTQQDIIHLAFLDKESKKKEIKNMQTKWSNAQFLYDDKITKNYFDRIFTSKNSKQSLHLMVRGTNFQIKVWQALLAIPSGKTVSYGSIAKKIGRPKAVRAVGSACGKNTIGYLIPCHRVLTASGDLGGYRWGIDRKAAILAHESV